LHVYYGLLVKNVDYNKIIRVRTNIWNNPPYSPYLCFGLLFGKKKTLSNFRTNVLFNWAWAFNWYSWSIQTTKRKILIWLIIWTFVCSFVRCINIRIFKWHSCNRKNGSYLDLHWMEY